MKLAFLMSAIGPFPEAHAYQACQLATALNLPLTGVTTSEDTLNHYVPVDGSYVDMLSASVEAAEINLKRSAETFREICAEKKGLARMVWHAWIYAPGMGKIICLF